jgi:hypothetical protein
MISIGSLVIVGLLQGLTMRRQSRIMKETADDVHQQASWMKTQAEEMNQQTKKLSESIEIAEKNATATLPQIQMMSTRRSIILGRANYSGCSRDSLNMTLRSFISRAELLTCSAIRIAYND